MVGAWLGMATGQISIDAARNPGIATNAAKFKEGMIRLQEDAKANPSNSALSPACAIIRPRRTS